MTERARILSEVIALIIAMENDPGQDPYLWGHGTLDVRQRLEKMIAEELQQG